MDSSEILQEIAVKAMRDKGLATDFSQSVLQQLSHIEEPAPFQDSMRDLRHMLWSSIDNDDSRDLDQLTVAERNPSGGYIAYIAIADVDSLVSKDSPIDVRAQINTTSVYTSAKIFPMLPDKLSTNLTSLNEDQERAAIVFEITLDEHVEILSFNIYRAFVKNKAKLAYPSVGEWLEGKKTMPSKIAGIEGLADNLHLQDEIARSLKKKRSELGALSFETREMKPSFVEGRVASIQPILRTRAHELIEHFMIAANTISANYALTHKIPSLRRIVRIPARWDRIVALAEERGGSLPLDPDSKALDIFLQQQRKADPETFSDLSLSIIKLLGSGEYVVEFPGDDPIGHFGLALRDYTHSTAPNRRYPDLITQRLLKATFQSAKPPYSNSELEALAFHCTQQEDNAVKVERQVKKSAAAMLLSNHIGETFDAIVTGASEKGTWVRLRENSIEGKLVAGATHLDVGDRITVKLVSTDITLGFIDFIRVPSGGADVVANRAN